MPRPTESRGSEPPARIGIFLATVARTTRGLARSTSSSDVHKDRSGKGTPLESRPSVTDKIVICLRRNAFLIARTILFPARWFGRGFYRRGSLQPTLVSCVS
jgi:hypothetical protein